MDTLSYIADIVGILGAAFAAIAGWQAYQVRQALEKEKQRQNKKVTVILQCGAKKIKLPVEIRRAELTRS